MLDEPYLFRVFTVALIALLWSWSYLKEANRAASAWLQQEIDSIVSRLHVLPDDTQVYPGHGANTTIGTSKVEYAVFAAKQHDPSLSGDVLWLKS